MLYVILNVAWLIPTAPRSTTTWRIRKMEKRTFSIASISCEHCVRAIKDELGELDGVVFVEGDPEGKTATVGWEDPATLDIIRSALAGIDYPAA